MPRGCPVHRVTICLPPAYMHALRELANRHHGGNLSAAIRELLEQHPVTKSLLLLP